MVTENIEREQRGKCDRGICHCIWACTTGMDGRLESELLNYPVNCSPFCSPFLHATGLRELRIITIRSIHYCKLNTGVEKTFKDPFSYGNSDTYLF